MIVTLTRLGEVLLKVTLRLEAGYQLLRLHELLVGALLGWSRNLGRRLLHLDFLVGVRVDMLHNLKLD